MCFLKNRISCWKRFSEHRIVKRHCSLTTDLWLPLMFALQSYSKKSFGGIPGNHASNCCNFWSFKYFSNNSAIYGIERKIDIGVTYQLIGIHPGKSVLYILQKFLISFRQSDCFGIIYFRMPSCIRLIKLILSFLVRSDRIHLKWKTTEFVRNEMEYGFFCSWLNKNKSFCSRSFFDSTAKSFERS